MFEKPQKINIWVEFLEWFRSKEKTKSNELNTSAFSVFAHKHHMHMCFLLDENFVFIFLLYFLLCMWLAYTLHCVVFYKSAIFYVICSVFFWFLFQIGVIILLSIESIFLILICQFYMSWTHWNQFNAPAILLIYLLVELIHLPTTKVTITFYRRNFISFRINGWHCWFVIVIEAVGVVAVFLCHTCECVFFRLLSEICSVGR